MNIEGMLKTKFPAQLYVSALSTLLEMLNLSGGNEIAKKLLQ